MSKILFQKELFPLRHVVQTEDGLNYAVDSCRTFEGHLETIVFKARKGNGNITNYKELYFRRYSSEEEMETGHYEICENLEKYLH